jgi:hypothetical protein
MFRINSKDKKTQAGWEQLGDAVDASRRPLLALATIALLFACPSYGEEMRLADGPALAFGRYVASIQERNPFTEAGPIQVQIDASLPALEKSGSMVAIREIGASERSEYRASEFTGDSTVKREVIARYLAAQRDGEAMPYSSIAITPNNYKFRYLGSVQNPRGSAYIFQVTPRQRRLGLVEGQIWIDSETGVVVRQTGRFVKRPSVFVRRIDFVRDVELRDGKAYARTTRVTIDTRIVGTANLSISERQLETVGTDLAQ